jgi:hypothetical protein
MSYKNKKSQSLEIQNYKGNRYSGFIATNRSPYCEQLFEGRKFYRDNTFLSSNPNTVSFINNWRPSMGFFYGKVNFFEEPVYINEYYLKQTKTADTVFALAPVVDAYQDLYEYMKRQKLQTGNIVLSSDSIYRSIEAKKGWESINKNYAVYLQDLAVSFTEDYLTPAREKLIIDFKSFLKIFIEFATSGLTNNIPLTLTAYMRSRFCSPRVSGLVIDVFNADHGDDTIKEGFLRDVGYSFWAETAEKFGFFVNKNAPWSLTANIVGSVPFSRYMSAHGVPFEENEKTFDTFYRSVYDIEMPIMSHYLAELYNNYVISRPTIAVASLKNYALQKGSYERRTSICTIERLPLKCFKNRKLDSESDYVKKYGELFWIRYYYFLRMLEEKKHMNNEKFNQDFKKKILPYYRVHGMVPTIRAINQELVRASPFAEKATRELRNAGYKPRNS